MWIQALILCLSCLSQSEAQQRSSPHRSSDQAGQCQYTFTVTSPVESSCSAGSVRPELDGVISRLTLLEALVSRLIAGVDGSAGAGVEATGEEVLQEAYTQVTLERDQLEQEKENLNKQVLELQRRLDEQVREAESLKQKPCPQTHTSGGSQRREQPARGTCITETNHVRRLDKNTNIILGLFLSYLFAVEDSAKVSLQEGRPGFRQPCRVESADWNLQLRIFFYGFAARACSFICM